MPQGEGLVSFEQDVASGRVEIQTVLDFAEKRYFTIRLPRLDARVDGTVANAAKAMTSLELLVRTPGGFTVQRRWTMEKDGAFTFEALPAGPLTVRVVEKGMPTGQSQFFELTAGTNTIHIDLAPARGSFAGRVEGRVDPESLMLILWRGEIEIDLPNLTMGEIAKLQSSAARAIRLEQKDAFEATELEPGVYTYWLLAADQSNPPRTIEEFSTKVRSAVGTVTVPSKAEELVITLPAGQ